MASVGQVQAAAPARHSHARQLQRRRPAPLEHPVHEHAVLAETAQVEVAARVRPGLRGFRGGSAMAAARGREDLQVAPRDEARMTHAHIYRALRRVAPDGHRTLLHEVLELAAFEPRHGPAARRGSAAPSPAARRRGARARERRRGRHRLRGPADPRGRPGGPRPGRGRGPREPSTVAETAGRRGELRGRELARPRAGPYDGRARRPIGTAHAVGLPSPANGELRRRAPARPAASRDAGWPRRRGKPGTDKEPAWGRARSRGERGSKVTTGAGAPRVPVATLLLRPRLRRATHAAREPAELTSVPPLRAVLQNYPSILVLHSVIHTNDCKNLSILPVCV